MKDLQKPKKPERVEKHACPNCGGKATTSYYGIDRQGNEDYVTDCENSRCSSHRKAQHLSQFEVSVSKYPTFVEWMMLREGKKKSDEEKQAYNDFISGKTDKLTLQSKVTGIERGHQQHISGSGVHDSRPKRMRTRSDQKRGWAKDYE